MLVRAVERELEMTTAQEREREGRGADWLYNEWAEQIEGRKSKNSLATWKKTQRDAYGDGESQKTEIEQIRMKTEVKEIEQRLRQLYNNSE